MMRAVLLALLLLFASHAGAAEAPVGTIVEKSIQTPAPSTPSANVEVLNPDVEVGESVRVRVKLPAKAAYESFEIEVPEAQQKSVYFGDVRQVSEDTIQVDVRPLQAGELKIGPLTIKAKPRDSQNTAQMQADGFALNVKNPPGEFTNEFEDFTDPASKPFDYLWRNIIIGGSVLVIAGGSALAATAIVLALVRTSKKKRIPPPTPPVEQALQWVHDLSDLHVYHANGPEEHYTRLSMALRFYLERQFGHHALEMSEDEVIALLENAFNGHDYSTELLPVLRRSSMAKFARQALTEDVARGDCETAEQFLQSEREYLRRLMAAEQQRRAEQAKAGAGA